MMGVRRVTTSQRRALAESYTEGSRALMIQGAQQDMNEDEGSRDGEPELETQMSLV